MPLRLIPANLLLPCLQEYYAEIGDLSKLLNLRVNFDEEDHACCMPQ